VPRSAKLHKAALQLAAAELIDLLTDEDTTEVPLGPMEDPHG